MIMLRFATLLLLVPGLAHAAPATPRHKSVIANGVRFEYLEAGKGPLVLMLHGYPDTPHTWKDLMPKVAARGYRVVAPFMRGYPSSGPAPDQDYSALNLGKDALALIDALGEKKAHVIGHDWGAFAAYSAANLDPSRVDRLVTLAIPHPRAVRRTPSLILKGWHFLTLPLPGAAKRIRRGGLQALDRTIRRWSPSWNPSDEELEPIKASLGAPGGIENALGYYRANLRDTVLFWTQRARAQRAVQERRTSVPTLTLYGNEDGALDVKVFAKTDESFTGPYLRRQIDGAGHFVHREQPERVAAEILDFLGDPAAR
jgi:pimeloyl-ACP methyl ester carboxylesterase